MPEVFMTCPFCRERRANIALTLPKVISPDPFNIITPTASIRANGICYLCKNEAFVFLSATRCQLKAPELSQAISSWANAKRLGENLTLLHWAFAPVQTLPPITPYQIPHDLPPCVHDALLEAHENAADQRWRSAVMGYATALEFACIDLLQGDLPNAPLGGKLKALKGAAQLPPSLLDFMEIVNLDRRAAGHYTEAVTEAACEATRALTVTTLEYLYSLPAEISAAKLRLEAAKEAGNS